MKPSDVGIEGFLRHIYQETSFITTYLSTLTHEEYEQNRVSRYALVRSLEIIGEAAKHIPETYRSEHPEIPWKLLAGNRDTLIHGYFTIDYDVLWNTVTVDIPALHKQIAVLLGALSE
ncbi:MAG TPA: DUF86 domain-containing protein [Methanocorpusculum sp.]|nr:DUF86 domain-containing protein [Methanocorpusculum sp.]